MILLLPTSPSSLLLFSLLFRCSSHTGLFAVPPPYQSCSPFRAFAQFSLMRNCSPHPSSSYSCLLAIQVSIQMPLS